MSIKLLVDKRYQDFLNANYIEYNKIDDRFLAGKIINENWDYIYWDEKLKTEITYCGKDIIKILNEYKPKKFYE